MTIKVRFIQIIYIVVKPNNEYSQYLDNILSDEIAKTIDNLSELV